MYRIELVRSGGNAAIYDQSRMNTLSSMGPKLSLEVNTSGILNFTMLPGHPLYNSIEPLSSFVRVLDDGEEIYYGRVIRRSEPTLTGQVTIDCEGAISFLLDSEVPPDPKDSRGNQQTRTLTAQEFFEWCIGKHNAEVNDARRQFLIGTISASRRSESSVYSITSYTDTKSAIESNITNVYGGFIRVRPKANSTEHYIDWIEDYPTLNPQQIAIGTNLEDQTNETDGTSVFTVLRPIGANGLELTEKTIDLYSASDLTKYGRIVKSIQFSSCETEEALRTKANEYKNWIQKTLFINSDISLVDMHYIDGSIPKIRVGDRFNNIAGIQGTEMIAFSMDLDLEHPENDSLSLKNKKSLNPDQSFDGHGHNNKNFSRGRGGGGGGLGLKYYRESMDEALIAVKNLKIQVSDLDINVGNLSRETAAEFQRISSRADNIEELIHHHTEKINDIEMDIDDIYGTAVIQNSAFISNVAGKFELWRNPTTGVESLHLVDGAELAIDDANGQTVIVGERLAWQGQKLSDLNSITDTITGSALWTQRDNITGIVGEFDVHYQEVEDPDNPGHYIIVKKLVVKSGGGFNIRKDNVEYGIYMVPEGGDSAVLTGGVIVNKINNETNTKILGTRVNITAQQMASIGIYTEDHFDAGFIVDRINNDTNATITADHIILTGNVNLNSVMSVLSGSVHMNATTVFGAQGSQSSGTTVRGGTINTQEVGANYYYVNSGETSYLLNVQNLSGSIKTAEVDTLTNTLILTRWDGSVVNFSKAASGSDFYLDGTWSGAGRLVVAAKSILDDSVLQSLERNLTTGPLENQDGTSYSGGANCFIPIRSYHGQTPPTYEPTYFRAQVNLDETTITRNGTFSYSPSSINIGWRRVTVNVPNDYTGLYVDAGASTGQYFFGVFDAQQHQIGTIPSATYKLALNDSEIQVQRSNGSKWYLSPTARLSSSDTIANGVRTITVIVTNSDNSASIWNTFSHEDYNDGLNAAKISGSWSSNAFTYSISDASSAVPSETMRISTNVGMQSTGCYAYATWTSTRSTTPTSINGTSKQLTIVNVNNNTVKLQVDGADTGLTFTHNKYTAGLNAAKVTGSWNSNAFTYSISDASSAVPSETMRISTNVGMQSTGCYAYATWVSSSSTTPTSISGTSKKLTIVDVNNNTVKLQADGSDTGLTYTHGKYTITDSDITTSWASGYSSSNHYYEITGGSGSSTACRTAINVTVHGHTREIPISAPITYAYRDAYSAGIKAAKYIVPSVNSRYQNNYSATLYTESGGSSLTTIGANATYGVHIPLSENGANANSANLTPIPSGGITANGNYTFASGYMGIRYLSVNVPASGYASRTMYCSKVENTYPGSTSKFYYFRLEGVYSFSQGSSYTMYRPSWPT